MRIVLLTLGSLGDVYPFIALGQELQAAGHNILLVTHAEFEPLLRSRGLNCFSIETNPRAMLESDSGQAWLNTGSNPLLFFHQFSRLAASLIQQVTIECWHACQDAEAIVFSTIALCVGYSIAEKLNIPCYMAAPYPLTPTRLFASPYFPAAPSWFPWNELYNRQTHSLSLQFFWQLLRPAMNKARNRVLDLPGLPPCWLPQQVFQGKIPVLYCYSSQVVPRPADWREWNNVTGYWFLNREANWQPPQDLVDFLAAGPPPVYVGFGSMKSAHPQAVTGIVVNALQRTGQRAVLLTGWGGLSAIELPAEVFSINTVPHDWLFPQMKVAIHHGGSGTSGAAFRAGIPSITVPFFGDQAFWGQRAFELGVGAKPLPHKQLSVERLAAAIDSAINSENMRSRAADLGERIRQENGTALAAEILERQLGRKM